MNNNKLFRQAALDARHVNWLGEILLIRPLSFGVLTGFAVASAILIVAFLIWGSYTQRSAVSGQLIPDQGLVKIYTPQFGIVLEKHVTEGQAVKKGDVLYVLSSDRQNAQGDTQGSISRDIQTRQQSLQDEQHKTQAIQADDRVTLSTKIADIRAQIGALDGQIASQESRVGLAQETLSRYRGLLDKDFISREQYQQKEEDMLDQQNRLQGYRRDRITATQELNAQEGTLRSLDMTQSNQLAQIKRNLASANQELTESESKRGIVITASESGIATAVTAEVGQAIDNSKPLVSIVPARAQLQAQLYAPSRAIGFVNPGDPVILRYQAYPYQKFGHAHGTVISVSKTALPGSDLNAFNANSNSAQNSEPMYRIIVRLDTQTVTAYGKSQTLQSGMLVDADIMQEKRRLYEWVLDPLYSITGKL